ncbi:MAG: hypothetical protein A4E19_19550 [Nitrospira sp. SG-bin1]|nr:MAG: hypothetical protein A4E19_19550 [Nitrospira sp. SG-bin1]
MSRAGLISAFLALVVGFPLLGVLWAGEPLWRYLEFPPRTRYVQHEPFSWPVFLALSLLIVLTVGPMLLRVVNANLRPSFSSTQHSALNAQHRRSSFPWWGWVGIGWTGLWWVVAWTRLPLLAPVQEQTFTPLWLGYITIVNAFTFARIGRCMMLHRPRYFLSLFPLSAAFWWLFEYLNRFVQNWHYVGVAELSSIEYFLKATIPFSTVLPAVIGTAELLTSCPAIGAGLHRFKPVRLLQKKWTGWFLLVLSCCGLFGIGLWPNYLFPLVWVGPLLLVVSLQELAGRPTVLSAHARGDWRRVWIPALAGLICGVFWELWNWKSLAHWEYAIPFVHRFELFEMPFLGYAGYLPFGVECVAMADFCLSREVSAKSNPSVMNNGHC